MKIIDRKKLPKIGIMTKILAVFLGLFILSFALLGYIAFNNIEGVGDYTLESSFRRDLYRNRIWHTPVLPVVFRF
jgi:dolichyl-phosphate-mannose--protein O-mannosyl transferase